MLYCIHNRAYAQRFHKKKFFPLRRRKIRNKEHLFCGHQAYAGCMDAFEFCIHQLDVSYSAPLNKPLTTNDHGMHGINTAPKKLLSALSVVLFLTARYFRPVRFYSNSSSRKLGRPANEALQ